MSLALAARVVFAISPNSASCERVFALLKRLFGEQQMSSLADKGVDPSQPLTAVNDYMLCVCLSTPRGHSDSVSDGGTLQR